MDIQIFAILLLLMILISIQYTLNKILVEIRLIKLLLNREKMPEKWR